MFGIATGVLGYTPDVARACRVADIAAAFEAKKQWVRMCNGEDIRPPAQRIAEQLRKIGK